jgi:hypothetical protein
MREGDCTHATVPQISHQDALTNAPSPAADDTRQKNYSASIMMLPIPCGQAGRLRANQAIAQEIDRPCQAGEDASDRTDENQPGGKICAVVTGSLFRQAVARGTRLSASAHSSRQEATHGRSE